ncbi:hypothetical protein WJX84_006442 [Apatococcus fuscideae]|uniref:Uncharacterized protein n=1 Tax=Apatococcus fuscideae TaxID=2026836 RepID=A0AAW1T6L9_9CHLO
MSESALWLLLTDYLLAHKCPFHYDGRGIGEHGHLQSLEWIMAQAAQLWDLRTWQNSKRLQVDPRMPLMGFCEGAALTGHMSILDWASEHDLLPGTGTEEEVFYHGRRMDDARKLKAALVKTKMEQEKAASAGAEYAAYQDNEEMKRIASQNGVSSAILRPKFSNNNLTKRQRDSLAEACRAVVKDVWQEAAAKMRVKEAKAETPCGHPSPPRNLLRDAEGSHQ